MKNVIGFFCFIFVAAMTALPASADPYTVGGIAVDVTAGNYDEARTQARAEARLRGAGILINRLTLPQDRSAATSPIDLNEIARFYRYIDTEAQEKRTATRYISTLAVTFDAEAVRKYLEARNVPFVEGSAGLALIVPVVSENLDPLGWGNVWRGGATSASLIPFVASVESWDRPPRWSDVEAEMRASAASRVIAAAAYLQRGDIYVRLSEVTASGADTSLAIVGPFGTLENAQAGAADALEQAWKQATIVRTTGAAAMSAVAVFADISQWVTIRSGLEASRIVHDLTVESISTRGADLSFVFSGRPDQLAADLRSRGLSLSGTDDGWIIQANASR